MSRSQRIGLLAARLLLGIWSAGLVVAAFQLGAWRQELSTTLVQVNADARFLARVRTREGVDPEWYRRKALALLSATERLRRDAAWSLFIPGSWNAFDDLEERVQARLEREFGEIVAETLRRELLARGRQLTGVPLDRGGAGWMAATACHAPATQSSDRAPANHAWPEIDALARYVASVRQLDDALQAYVALHHAAARPEQLHKLVRYALDKELPVSLAHSARMFQVSDTVNVAPALLRSQLQWAATCSLLKGMGALHARALEVNELFRLEQALSELSTGLFDAAARMAAASDRTLERYRAVHALLEAQHELLSQGNNAWMRSGRADFGPGYATVLAAVEATPLLGPQVLQQLHQQSAAAFAEFRRQFEHAFGHEGDTGIAWLESEQRFGLSPHRQGLRAGLAELLQLPFMADEREARRRRGRPHAGLSLPLVAVEASVFAEAHARFMEDGLPLFPDSLQPAVTRFVNARASELIYQKAYRVLRTEWSTDAAGGWDASRFQRQREQAAEVQAHLKAMGGAYFAKRLNSAFDDELLRQLALLEEAARQPPLQEDVER